MRIPVRAQLNGYTPALNPFSKDKLVWVKIDTKFNEVGIPGKIAIVGVAISTYFGARWSHSFYNKQDDINVYRDLGHDKFVFLFILAALIGVLSYIWGLFVYDFKKTKKYPLAKSIELYKKTSRYSKEKQTQTNNLKQRRSATIFLIIYVLFFFSIGFLMLFRTSKDWRLSGMLFGMLLSIPAYLTYRILYTITVSLSHRYLNRKFNIKFNDKSPKSKNISK